MYYAWNAKIAKNIIGSPRFILYTMPDSDSFGVANNLSLVSTWRRWTNVSRSESEQVNGVEVFLRFKRSMSEMVYFPLFEQNWRTRHNSWSGWDSNVKDIKEYQSRLLILISMNSYGGKHAMFQETTLLLKQLKCYKK